MQIDLKNINLPNPAFQEAHGFFVRDGKHLFRADYLPRGETASCLVLCSPFAEEKVRTQRVYVSFARALASAGTGAVCFDYYGDGDSEGDFEDARFEDRLLDIKAVYQDACEQTGARRTALLGLRWGATLAALAAEELQPDFLVLWDPVVDTDKYFRDHLRSHLASQMLTEGKVIRNREQLIEDLKAGQVLTVEGYNLTGDFFFAASQAGLVSRTFARAGKTLVMQVGGIAGRIRPELTGLQAAMKDCTLQAVPREFQWDKTEIWQPAPPRLFEQTLNYLDEHGFFGRVL
jgi:alpha/beta superfamily hydrolase